MNELSRTLYAGKYLDLAEVGGWEFARRHHPAVVLVAWTPSDELLLVEQHRIPVDGRTIELPAGLVGDEDGRGDESILAAAGRELEEETGWRAGDLEVIMRCPTSAGMTNEVAIFIRATQLVQTGPGGGDDSEEITVHRVPRNDVDAFLTSCSRRGIGVDPKVFAALYWFDRERR